MRTISRAAPVLVVVALLAGCAGNEGGQSADADGSLDPAPPASVAASLAASEEVTPSEPAATQAPTTEPIPSDELGAFTCELPIIEPASVAEVANIVDVRIGEHAGYDRVVFEFAQGTPEFTLDRATPPFTSDGSGFPVDVDGDSFLGLTMRGGSRQMDDGSSSYDGPSDFDPGFVTLVDLVEGGDFERQSTWYLGLSSEACVRVLLLDGPPRLVIDVEQP